MVVVVVVIVIAIVIIIVGVADSAVVATINFIANVITITEALMILENLFL